MKAEKIAEKAMTELIAAVGSDLSEQQLGQIRAILTKLTIDVARDTAAHCTKRAAEVYRPKTDLAAAIADEIKRSETAIVANLQSMR